MTTIVPKMSRTNEEKGNEGYYKLTVGVLEKNVRQRERENKRRTNDVHGLWHLSKRKFSQQKHWHKHREKTEEKARLSTIVKRFSFNDCNQRIERRKEKPSLSADIFLWALFKENIWIHSQMFSDSLKQKKRKETERERFSSFFCQYVDLFVYRAEKKLLGCCLLFIHRAKKSVEQNSPSLNEKKEILKGNCWIGIFQFQSRSCSRIIERGYLYI